jgi:8-oxo-dGTP pyrophosphatase MutT (NUDIX family)
MTWKPHVTTAVVVARDQRFLMVEERSDGRVVFNQPAGHIEPGESIFDAARREALEETGWSVRLSHFLGLYTYLSPVNDVTYFRFSFLAEACEQASTVLDPDIIAAHWLSLEEIRRRQEQLRSPLVLECINDYLDGKRYPLELIRQFHIADV